MISFSFLAVEGATPFSMRKHSSTASGKKWHVCMCLRLFELNTHKAKLGLLEMKKILFFHLCEMVKNIHWKCFAFRSFDARKNEANQ